MQENGIKAFMFSASLKNKSKDNKFFTLLYWLLTVLRNIKKNKKINKYLTLQSHLHMYIHSGKTMDLYKSEYNMRICFSDPTKKNPVSHIDYHVKVSIHQKKQSL